MLYRIDEVDLDKSKLSRGAKLGVGGRYRKWIDVM